MNKYINEIKEIIAHDGEGRSIDFKAVEYKRESYSDLLKDIMAMANSFHIGNRYIICGVKYLSDTNKQILGVECPMEAAKNKKSSKKKMSYQLPNDLYDIMTSPPPLPSVDLVRQNIMNLASDLLKSNLAQYIDIYRGNYAMMKGDYTILKYRNKELGSKCRKWCDNIPPKSGGQYQRYIQSIHQY